MRNGIVLEGGAMRGLFSAGVLDVFMEKDIVFDGAIGVSAGAAFGCNLKSKQIGRVIRYNTKYCKDKRFASFRNYIKTGDIYGADFCYVQIPNVLDPFDIDTYVNNPMEFIAVCTDVRTGKPIYHECVTGDELDVKWFRASASMPLASRIVEIDDKLLLDGGVSDSIPIKYMQNRGYTKNVVILTQPKDYVKTPNKFLPIIRRVYRKYPDFVKAVANRHIDYNNTLDYIKQQEKSGSIYVIRPPKALGVHSIERDENKLLEVYELGRQTGLSLVEEVKAFLEA